MSNIKSLDRLREFVEEDALLVEMVEAVEHEIAEKFVELPCDAEGVPIRCGDRMRLDNGHEGEVWLIGAQDIMMSDHTCFDWARSRHVKPRTLEDVLAAFAAELHSDRIDSLDRRIERCAARYADEIRGMMA